jgi:hypothetical protein
MGALVLGALALLFALLLLRWFVGADPRALMKGLRYFGSFAWGLFTGGHAWPGGWPHGFPRGRAQPKNHNTSHVQTEWLDMVLDHDSGEMNGTVRKGEHAGVGLEALSKGQLSAVLRMVSVDDSESERLLSAYLERRFGADWRATEEPGKRPPDSGMTRAEALRVLGLEPGAGEDEIRAAHRRLMLQNHPDKGGTSYLAAKINEAKDILLGN